MNRFTLTAVAVLSTASVVISAAKAAELPSYAPIDLIGRGFTQTLNNEVQQAIRAYGRDGIFWGITGTLKPFAEVTYQAGGLKTVSVRGTTGSGAEFRLTVVASAKLDAGTGPFTTKIAKVITEQQLVIRVLPTIQNGRLGITGEAEVVSATAQKERQAKQRQADEFRDKIRAEIIRKINERLSFVPVS